MNLWYTLVELLPFEWVTLDFMKNALLAVCLMAPLFGLLSTNIVTGKMSFFSDALGHSAFTGIAIGVLCGLSAAEMLPRILSPPPQPAVSAAAAMTAARIAIFFFMFNPPYMSGWPAGISRRSVLLWPRPRRGSCPAPHKLCTEH